MGETHRDRVEAELNRIWYGYHNRRHQHFESSRYLRINLHNVWYRGVIEFRWFVWSGTRSPGKIKSIHGTIQGARCQITVFHPWLDAIAARTRSPILSTPLIAARVTISVSFPANPLPEKMDQIPPSKRVVPPPRRSETACVTRSARASSASFM